MGITAGPSYTTDEGFVISPLYLSVNSMRFTVTADGDLHCVYTVKGYKSRADKKAGRNAINLPQNLSLMDSFVSSSVLATENLYTVTYLAIKRTWGLAGFQVEDVHEPGQPGYVDANALAAAVAAAATADAAAAQAKQVAAAADALAAANPTNAADVAAAVLADEAAAQAVAIAETADAAALVAEETFAAENAENTETTEKAEDVTL